jgi:uncharacterized protein
MKLQRKNFSPLLSFTAFLIAWCTAGYAVEFPAKPASEHFYVDAAGLIDAKSRNVIDEIANRLLHDKNINVPVFVVTITSLAIYDAMDYSIEEYAAKLFNAWGIGSQEHNNGILLLISMGDRKARIELGQYWGRSYDEDAKQIMDTLIIPRFKEGKYAQGIVEGVRGLAALARGQNIPQPTPLWWILPAKVLGTVLFFGLIYNLFTTGRNGWAWALISILGAVIFSILFSILLGFLLNFLRNLLFGQDSYRSSSGGSSRGSSGGFSGGSSGGGGATGSW